MFFLWGGIQAASPNPTGSVPVDVLIKDKPIVSAPGCPPIGEVMTAVSGSLCDFWVHCLNWIT
ncbi:MAG: hypothetical protein R2771_05245 [Saprospiraceae bacterium]